MSNPVAVPQKITKRLVDSVVLPERGEARVWDVELKGFCVRVYASGRRVYAVKCRVGASQRWFTIGQHGSPWTPDQARNQAREILHSARLGHDVRNSRVEKLKDMTIDELIQVYLRDGPAIAPSKREVSWKTDEANLRNHVSPLIGRTPLSQVGSDVIAKVLKGVRNGATARDMRTGPRGRSIVRGGDGIAHRVKAATSAMFNWAIQRGLAENNPVDIKLPRRPIRERFLSPVESARLFSTLGQMVSEGSANAAHADILRLLLLTGARKSEIMKLTWPEVDLRARRLTLSPERTKSGGSSGERRIALSEAAAAILQRQVEGDTFVFPASRGAGAISGLQKTWDKVRDRTGLRGVRIHDFRHSFASFALADGASLSLIAKALGHSTTRVTERYAHLNDDPVVALASSNASRMLGETSSGGVAP